MFKRRRLPAQNYPYSLPAPTRGLDGLAPLMEMSPRNAVVFENVYPSTDGIETRDGYVSFTTGFANPVKRLHVYASGSGVDSLYATTDTGVFDASTAGVVGAAKIALTEGYAISTMIATGANVYMFLVNATDDMVRFDGTTWSSVATLGAVNTATFSYVEIYRQRMFFAVAGTLDLEYLSPNAISGSPKNYPLGAIFKQGGFIVALATWTIDGGNGPEDKFVVITNKGQAAVFVGNDPATWSFQGVYNIGRPLGAKCAVKWGGDLLLITESGLTPLSTALQSSDILRTQTITQKVRPQLTALAKAYAASGGWEVLIDPLEPWVLVNIPSTPAQQYVMNLETGGWARWTAIEALCWARVSNQIFFGTANAVCKLTGFSDNGANIVSTIWHAYNALNSPRDTQIKLVKPYFASAAAFEYQLGVASDFTDPREYAIIANSAAANSGVWGTSLWGECFWTDAETASQEWQTVPDNFSGWKSLAIQITSRVAKVKYYGSDLLYTKGGSF